MNRELVELWSLMAADEEAGGEGDLRHRSINIIIIITTIYAYNTVAAFIHYYILFKVTGVCIVYTVIGYHVAYIKIIFIRDTYIYIIYALHYIVPRYATTTTKTATAIALGYIILYIII